MEKVFIEEDGDRGANRIITKQKKNVHALWDQLLGDSFTLNGTRKRIVEITSDDELVAKGKQAVAATDGLNASFSSEVEAVDSHFVEGKERRSRPVLLPLESGMGIVRSIRGNGHTASDYLGHSQMATRLILGESSTYFRRAARNLSLRNWHS